jgi:superfamily II DNA/RNA helicase
MVRGAVLATGESQRSAAIALSAFVRGRAAVLVTTDVAAEGLNLQRAGCIVHYDIPWNPVRLDQRNGRAHRIGQLRPEVAAYYFVPEYDFCGVTSVVAAKNRVRSRIDRTRGSAAGGVESTMRSRLERGDAAERLFTWASASRAALPEGLDRRHRAGLERLVGELSTERLDRAKLRHLEELVAAERSLVGGAAPL